MKRGSKLLSFAVVQVVFVGAFAASYATLSTESTERFNEVVLGEVAFKPLNIDHDEPYVIGPLYNEVEVVTDEELAAVLSKVLPLFKQERLRPNVVEHAMRTWHEDAIFTNPDVMSGMEMRDFLIDHGRFLLSWENQREYQPLLSATETGVHVLWSNDFIPGASVHHDHTLACLSEARVKLSQPVRTRLKPNLTMADMVNQAVYDFSLDEKETEWSAMAFGLWLPPQKEWVNGKGRKLNFDMIAERQLRGHQQHGVCGGTHRLYSLMALLRLDEEHGPILSKPMRKKVYTHLLNVGHKLAETQFEDGHWPYNWPDGKDAVENPADHPMSRSVIATGHHLEWLAIAPKEMHPPRENIIKAAKWIIANTTGRSRQDILNDYTFYSHVGHALCLWRNTRPSEFWKRWEVDHPYDPVEEAKAKQALKDSVTEQLKDKKTKPRDEKAVDPTADEKKAAVEKPDDKKADQAEAAAKSNSVDASKSNTPR
jgi:hypothetical protein